MKKEKKNKEASGQAANQQLLNIITPPGIDFNNNYASIGEGVGKIYCINRYPSDVDYGWLAQIVNMPGTAAVVEYRYSPEDRLVKAFNKRISELKSLLETEKKESERQKIEYAMEDLKKMINRISVKKEPVGYFNIMLHIQETKEELLNQRIRKISGLIRMNECNMRHLKSKQKDALTAMAPWGIPNPNVSNAGERIMPMSTFIGGFPMAAAGLNDEDGYCIGKARDRVVLLNIWLRGNDRTNSNFYIQGIPGTGKSTFVKFIQQLEYALNNTTQIVWDAECEYIDMAKHPWINGEIIDCASGSESRVNPLQIRYTPRVTQEDLQEGEDISEFLAYDEEMGFSDMALHIQNLRQFFSIYFGNENFKDPGIRKVFEEGLIETYRKRNITWETDISALKNEDFPVMKEFYETVQEGAQKKEYSARKREYYERLGEMLYSIGEGADQFLWNGYTTLNPKSQYIVLNTSKLLEMDDNIRNAQFFNLKMWQWHRMSKDRTEKVMAWMDEGYLFADPEFPQLMKFTRNESKRGRKYEAALGFITHAASDVLDPAVKRFSQAVIDNSCYKFLLGCDSKGLQETADLFKLTEKEVAILESRARGKGILFAGKIRLELQVDVPDKLLEIMGRAGGR